MTIWRKGMKACCIKSENWDVETGMNVPEKGHVYTVAEVFTDWQGEWLVFSDHGDVDDLWSPRNFRTVATSQTDISIFKQILDNPHIDIEDTVDA